MKVERATQVMQERYESAKNAKKTAETKNNQIEVEYHKGIIAEIEFVMYLLSKITSL